MSLNVTQGLELHIYKMLVGKPEDLAVDGRIILKWIAENRVGMCGLNPSSSGYGPVVGSIVMNLQVPKKGNFLTN
jgi:hypothetical protein